MPTLDHPSIFITDKMINNFDDDDANGKCGGEEVVNEYDPKYPTPDDRDPKKNNKKK